MGKLTWIKDSEVVVNKYEYELLKKNYNDLKSYLESVKINKVSYHIDRSGLYPRVKVTNGNISLPIKSFNDNDPEYNRICAEELCEMLNQEQ